MAIKTHQIYDPAYPLDISPDLDRFAHPHEPSRIFLTDMVNRGELPRYRGSEVQFITTPTSLEVIMEWKSREVAQEYVDFVNATSNSSEPNSQYLRSIEIIED